MNSCDVSVALHVAPVRLRLVGMVAAVNAVLVGIEPVGGVKRHPTTTLLFVDLLGEAGDKRKMHLNMTYFVTNIKNRNSGASIVNLVVKDVIIIQ